VEQICRLITNIEQAFHDRQVAGTPNKLGLTSNKKEFFSVDVNSEVVQIFSRKRSILGKKLISV